MEPRREAVDVGGVGHDDAGASGEHHRPGDPLVQVVDEILEDREAIAPADILEHRRNEEEVGGKPGEAKAPLKEEGGEDVGHEVRNAIDDVVRSNAVSLERLPDGADCVQAGAEVVEAFVPRVDRDGRDRQPGAVVDFIFRERLRFRSDDEARDRSREIPQDLQDDF